MSRGLRKPRLSPDRTVSILQPAADGLNATTLAGSFPLTVENQQAALQLIGEASPAAAK
jgi:hypothetical protein